MIHVFLVNYFAVNIVSLFSLNITAATSLVVVGHAAHALRSPFGSLHTNVAARVTYDVTTLFGNSTASLNSGVVGMHILNSDGSDTHAGEPSLGKSMNSFAIVADVDNFVVSLMILLLVNTIVVTSRKLPLDVRSSILSFLLELNVWVSRRLFSLSLRMASVVLLSSFISMIRSLRSSRLGRLQEHTVVDWRHCSSWSMTSKKTSSGSFGAQEWVCQLRLLLWRYASTWDLLINLRISFISVWIVFNWL